MALRKVTHQEYLEWMALKSRMNDWGAFVAYDRDKCNHLLLQEYIEKFDKNAYMPPISEPFGDGQITWNWLIDYQTDVPRLSFENNPDQDGNNVAEANMRMAIVGGTTIMLTGTSANPKVLKISSYDPLDHPELTADRVLLSDIMGEVGKDGAVVLDLGAAVAQRHLWELGGSEYQHERRVAGAFMKRKFREAEPAQRTFKLGQLAYTAQDHLKPQKFRSRIVMEQGANVAKASNFGNGALELRIAMEGEPLGGWPGDDWLYPFPSDRPEVNASLMIANKLLMEKILVAGMREAFDTESLEFKIISEENGFITKLKALGSNRPAYLSFKGFFEHELDDFYTFRVTFGDIPVNDPLSTETMEIRNDSDGWVSVKLGGVFQTWQALKLHFKYFGSSWANLFTKSQVVGYEVKLKFGIDHDQRRITVEVADSYALNFGMESTHPGSGMEDAILRLSKETEFLRKLANAIDVGLKNAFSKIDSVDAFVLHSLLFNSTDAVQLQSVDLAGDLVCFGSINPRLTTFSIDPAEKLLGYGATHTFATSPPVEGVTWSVQNLDGSTLNAGTIDAQTGVYTAPGLDQIDGTFKRVKVTAATESHTSKALVTIARRAITLNPQLQVSNASNPDPEVSPETVEFSANALTGALKWSVTGDGSIPETAQPDRINLYSVPRQQTLTGKTFTIDEIKVTNTQTTQVQSAFVLVEHHPSALTVKVELEGLAPEKAQFSVLFNGAEPTDPLVTAWHCFPETGAGSIDSNGLYTADPTSPYPFVIIKSALVMPYPTGDIFLGDGYSIQPLPLAPLPPKPSKPEDSQTLFEETPQT